MTPDQTSAHAIQVESADSDAYQYPTWFQRIGYWIVIPVSLAVFLLVWEETVASWKQGPQFLSWGFAHSGAIFLMVPFALSFAVWVPIGLGMVALVAMRRRRIAKASLGLLLLSLCATFAFLPSYGFWQRVFISNFSKESAIEFLCWDAGQGDLASVKAFVEHGVDVNADNRNFANALHIATQAGELEVMEYLIDHGADVNAVNMTAATPLDFAREARKNGKEAEDLLRAHGATRSKKDTK